MKFSNNVELSRGDAINYHKINYDEADRYSEWHHFNFNDNANGLYGIFNLSVSGDLRNSDHGRAAISLVVNERGNCWHGAMDLQPAEKVSFGKGSANLSIGKHFVRLENNAYHITGSLKDDSVSLNAIWTPETAGVRVTHIGGIINTFIIPRLSVNGTIRIGQQEYLLDGATGYHDHNWGCWDWGKDIGWDWGYLIQPSSTDKKNPEPVSIVFGQVTDTARETAKSDLVVMVWTGEKCNHIFLDSAISISIEGELTGIEIRRLPGLMALLYPGREQTVPQSIKVNAKDGDDYLNIRLDVENAIQFLIPHPQNTGKTVINEVVGTYKVDGRIDGFAFNFSYVGFAEITG